MKFKILKIVTVISAIIRTTLSEEFSTLNNVDNGVSCAPVYSSGSGSRILFHIENLEIEDNEKLDEIKIPFAFFRYTDTAFYDNFPDPKYYNSTYKSSVESRQNIYDRLVDFETNNIITERNNVYLKGILDDPNIRKGYLEYKKDTEKQIEREFVLGKSGIYCVLIAPPLDKGIRNLTIPIDVDYSTSLGMSFENYRSGYNYKLSIVVGVVLLICLCVVLNFSRNKDGIPAWVVYYGLIPVLFYQVIALSLLTIENNSNINSNTSGVFDFVECFTEWVILCFRTTIFYWFPLIFSMGGGVIYQLKNTKANGKLRELPSPLYKKSNYMLLMQIIASSAEMIYQKIYDPPTDPNSGILRAFIDFLGVHGILWLFWLALSIYHYSITKTSIQKFPSFEEPDVSVKITKAFRNSFLVMNFGVIAVLFIHGVLLILLSIWKPVSFFQDLVDEIGFGKSETISQVLSDESGLSTIFSYLHTLLLDYIVFLYMFIVWYNYNQAFNTKRE